MKWLAGLLAALWCHAALASGFNGIYVWGGYLSGYSGAAQVQQSVGYALARGWTTVRITISPGEMSAEGITSQCAIPSLACYAQIEFASSVWDNPSLQRVILTTLDWSCYGYEPLSVNTGCLYAPDLTANQASIATEYTALFNVLKTRFGNRNIQFILDNWEGDNYAYCGGAFAFGQTGTTAAACIATFPSGQTNVQRAAALVQWAGYRDAAVTSFVAENPTFNLISALQFNSLTLFCQQTKHVASVCQSTTSGCNGYCNPSTDTILDQITAAGGRTYCDYSSYDSLDNGALPTDVVNILSRGCQYLIIGEAGASGSAADGATPSSAQAVFNLQVCVADVNPNVLGSVIWNLIWPGTGVHYGMYNTDGSPQNIGSAGCLFPAQPAAPPWK
jgi:hypothetical protein